LACLHSERLLALAQVFPIADCHHLPHARLSSHHTWQPRWLTAGRVFLLACARRMYLSALLATLRSSRPGCHTACTSNPLNHTAANPTFPRCKQQRCPAIAVTAALHHCVQSRSSVPCVYKINALPVLQAKQCSPLPTLPCHLCVQSKRAVCLAFTLDEHWLDASYSDHYSLSLSLLPRHPCVPLLSSVSCTYLEYIGLDASYSDHYSLSLSLLPCHPCVQPKSSVPCAHSLYLDTSAGRYRNNAVCRALPYRGAPFTLAHSPMTNAVQHTV
jgi:hypothetical protein